MDTLSPLWIPAVAAYVGVAWAAVFHRLWGRRRYRLASLDYWSSCGGFVTLALMLTLPLPPVMAEIDRLAGLVGLADTLADGAALLTLCAWLAYLGRLVPPRERWLLSRRRKWWIPWWGLFALMALAITLLVGRFTWAPGRLEVRLGTHPDAGAFHLAAAHLTYRAACLVQLGLVILVLRRLAVVVGAQAALQARLRVIRWVLWYMLLYIAYDAAAVVLWQLPDLSSRIFRLRSLLLLAAIVAPNAWYLAGLTFARRLVTLFDSPLTHWHHWRTYRRLYLLWAALYPVRPGISHLSPPRRRAWRPGKSPTITTCRMIAEIHDWTIKLWPYQADNAVNIAQEIAREAGLPERDRLALVETVALAASIANWRTSCPTPVHAAVPQPGRPAIGGATLAEEIATLVPVADLFARSPLVDRALAQLRAEPSVPRGLPSNRVGSGYSSSTTRVVRHR